MERNLGRAEKPEPISTIFHALWVDRLRGTVGVSCLSLRNWKGKKIKEEDGDADDGFECAVRVGLHGGGDFADDWAGLIRVHRFNSLLGCFLPERQGDFVMGFPAYGFLLKCVRLLLQLE
ncbi:hypothetical protein Salat_1314100 [Sesamum alatum]|uniref:Uncharacterized protein n=1 Tax=Sesamum alatum TaxID=300844 RepID=A0AAE1YHF3_9LAMI|nr:hypothetical protein Salat_1314100 [Sesamum alatum]